MKLHLPLSLRLSLALSVAAIAAAPSHAAMTKVDISDWTGYQDGSVTVGRTVDEQGTVSINSQYVTLNPKPSWDTEWSVVFSVKASTLKGSLTLLGLELDSSSGTTGTVGIVEGAKISNGNLIFTTWAHDDWNTAQNPAAPYVSFSKYGDNDNITFVMSRGSDGKLTFKGYDSSYFAKEIFSHSEPGQSFSGYFFRGFVMGALGEHAKFDNDSNKVGFADDADIGSFEITKVGYSLGSVVNTEDLAGYYYGDLPHNNLTWNGGDEGNWSGASWSGAAEGTFSPFDSVTFETGGARVTVDKSVMANAISVNADTTIVLTHNLSANSVTVADGKELTLSGAGTAEAGTVDVGTLTGGTVHVNRSTVTVDDAVSVKTLTVENGGTVTAAGNVTITGGDSNLGGTVNVGGVLSFDSGTSTTVISGNVSASKVGGSATAVLQGSDDGQGRLTIEGNASSYQNGPSLKGNFTIVKKNSSYTQNFGNEGDNSGFTGSLVVERGIMNLASFGETTEVNLQDISISNGSTLRLYGRSLRSADARYKANVSANSLTVGTDGGNLTSNLTLGSTSHLVLGGTLTLDGSLTLNKTLLSGALLDGLSERGDMVTLVRGLAWSSLTIGSGVSTLAATDEAGQWTTDGYYQFSSAELEKAFRELDSGAYEMRYYGTANGTNGSLALAYVPEPTSATLSLLALAGLCARRRRR